MKKSFLILSLLVILLSFSVLTASAQDAPVVRAILFYSPYCQHCEYVINTVFPPLFDEYGDQLLILGVDVSQEWGSTLFNDTITEIGYPEDQTGVPFLMVADQVLIGSAQIPEEFPDIIASGISDGGIAWPSAIKLQDFLVGQGYINAAGEDVTPTPAAELATAVEEATATTPPEDTAEPTQEPTETQAPTTPPVAANTSSDGEITVFDENTNTESSFGDNFNRDKIANSLAIVVLVIMVAVVIWMGIQFMQASTPKLWPSWVLPVLLVLGLAIAIYLATVEVTGNEAICGPVGDCNAVQQSKYATLFGFLPVAILGIIGYVMIGVFWLTAKLTSGRIQFFATMSMFLFGLFGLIFFIYLTFLEPFVIGATCIWCISSAIIMTLINLHNTPMALNAWAEMDVDDYLDDEDE